MIPVSKPSIGELELKYGTDAIATGWISSLSPYIEKFETAWAKKNDMTHGVACSSGTTALLLALRALNIKEGDEVIVPEFTMVASAWAVTYTGATPVFVDCKENLTIDPEGIENAITPKTKAIMPVHIYGRQCDMASINALAHDYNLFVIEDSAEGHGILPTGDIACYSLFANKIITSGEGGICLTNNPDLAAQMKHLRAMAFDPEHTFIHKKLAYNFRMTGMQAAIALAQVERFDELLEKRRKIEEFYDKGLAGIEGVYIQPRRDVVWMYDVRVARRDELRAHLARQGVDTRVFFKPMCIQPMYPCDCDITDTNAFRASVDGLYLPTYPDITEEEMLKVIIAIRDFYED